MTLNETLEASQVLRRFAKSFENCSRAGKDIEARTYLPNIRKACEELNMDWRELLGIENERFFTDIKPLEKGIVTVTEPLQKRSLSVTEPLQNSPVIFSEDFIRSRQDVISDIIRSTTVQQIETCLNCGKSLKGMKKGAKYCGNTCRVNHNRNK